MIGGNYFMMYNGAQNLCRIAGLLTMTPDARAWVRGSEAFSKICGVVSFFQTYQGVFVVADFTGLPEGQSACSGGVFAIHIHEGRHCSGNAQDPFADSDGHYNPDGCPHPNHAGDMPPLFGNNGMAWMAFFTDRFTIREIIGRTVIVHVSPDDFTTQPSGNSGTKIACGIIGAV